MSGDLGRQAGGGEGGADAVMSLWHANRAAASG